MELNGKNPYEDHINYQTVQADMVPDTPNKIKHIQQKDILDKYMKKF
jgi:hypothetical protein